MIGPDPARSLFKHLQVGIMLAELSAFDFHYFERRDGNRIAGQLLRKLLLRH